MKHIMDFSKIRLAGFDLDNTAFTNDKRITPRTRRAIEAAIGRGITVIPATGRPTVGMPAEFIGIPGVRYLLGSNGAAVYDQAEKKFVVHDCMNQELVLTLLDAFEEEDGSFEVYIDGKCYIGQTDFAKVEERVPNPYIRDYVRRTRIVVEDLRAFLKADKREVEKINLCYAAKEKTDKGFELIRAFPAVQGSSGLPTNLELTRADVDKGSGLLKLAAYLGLKAEQTLACGDGGNDVPMIKKAGIGVAMANALEQVKAAADWVLPYTNEEEGVAWLLEHFCDTL